MTKGNTILADIDVELSYIENKIKALKAQIDDLNGKKLMLLSKMRNVDMDVVLGCIVEKGLTANDVLNLINNAGNPC